MILASVFLLSLSSLHFEVLLARFFSITQWHHFSFLVISIALFGISASGVLLNLMNRKVKVRSSPPPGPPAGSAVGGFPSPRLGFGCVLLFSLSVLAAYFIVREIPLDAFRLAVQPSHILFLVLTFVLLSLPFFFTGLLTAAAYSYLGRTGSVYLAAMLGSAMGALLPLATSRMLGAALLGSAFLPPFCLAVYRLCSGSRPAHRSASFRKNPTPTIFLLAVSAAAPILALFPAATRVVPSPYKAVSHLLQYPGTEILDNKQTIRGKMQTVRSPHARFAPGLSLRWPRPVPAQDVVVRDGDFPVYLYRPDETGFASFMLSHGAFVLKPDAERVLVILRAGGAAVPAAIEAGAGSITVVQELPFLARKLKEHYGGSGVEIVAQAPRSFLRRTEERWDVILVESRGASLPGMESLAEDHLLTVEGLTDCLSRLNPSGILAFERRLLMPPADTLGLLSSVLGAMRPESGENPARRLAMIRNYDTYALFVSAAPLPRKGLSEMSHFLSEMNFDWVAYPGMRREEANRYNMLEDPLYYDAVLSILNRGDAFEREYPLNVAARTDDRPFFSRFLKWGRMGELLRETGRGSYSLLLTGEVLVLILLAVGLLLGILLLLPPAVLSAGGVPFTALYFFFVGGGFMFFEIGYIEEFTFLLGDPVISFAAVLAGILLFSAIGGWLSDHLRVGHLKVLLAVLVLLAGASFWAVPRIVGRLLAAPLGLRALCAGLLLAGPSLLLGVPFPAALRILIRRPGQKAYAWAANGCASVFTSILATQIALDLGISRIFLFSGLCYLLALGVLIRRRG